MEDKKNIAWRVYLIYFGMGLICLFVLIRVVKIQTMDVGSRNEQAAQVTTQMRIIPAKKGNVYSDNGSLLATSNTVYDIYMDLKAGGLTDEVFNKHVDSLSIRLARMFRDKSPEDYKRMLIDERNDGNRYLRIAKKISYNQLKELKTFPIYRLGKNSGGLIIESINKRIRPYGILAARTIGYERPDPNNPQFITRVGIEGAFGSMLNGRDGKLLMRKIGSRWQAVSDKYDVTPEDGADVFSTIDIRLQNVAENALMDQLKKYKAKSGCVILMEVETGYIKAVANLSRSESDSSYYEYFNNAIGVATEPGSTFKTASLMVALDQGLVRMSDSVETGNGTHKYYNLTMTDSKAHGTISVHDALVYSSNIGVSLPLFRNAILKANPEKFVNGIKKIGLHLPLGIDLQGEAKPLVKDPNGTDWSGVSLPQMSIGYEVKLTPLQILAFYNAIANNGVMLKPLFVKEVKRNGKLLQSFEPVVLNNAICKPTTLKLIQKALEDVVEYGTASNLKAANFRIAGKTGTAQIYSRGTYQGKKYLASFVGYFPAENPKYSCIVSIMEPEYTTGYYGNAVAGPVFKEIADKIFSYNLQIHKKINRDQVAARKSAPKVKPGKSSEILLVLNSLEVKNAMFDFGVQWAKAQTKDGRVLLSELEDTKKGTMPDVKGMGLKDALFLLENSGLKVEVKGSGKVVKQSISSGAPITNGQKIILELKG